jgi:hypothetical protein
VDGEEEEDGVGEAEDGDGVHGQVEDHSAICHHG